jgi:hypothetical protein
MIKLDTVCELGKTIKATAKKDDKGVPTTIATIRFTDLKVDRDVVAELLTMPLPWVLSSFYDESGAPLRRFFLGVRDRQWRVSGGLNGPKPGEGLVLLQADLEKVEMTLVPNGALLEGTLTWAARGDEIDDISPILGTTVRAVWEITEGGQADMFDAQSAGAMRATATTQDILAGLGKGTPPNAPDMGASP